MKDHNYDFLTQVRENVWEVTLKFPLDGEALVAIARMDDIEEGDREDWVNMNQAWDLLKAIISCDSFLGASFCSGWSEIAFSEWHLAVSAVRESWNEMERIALASTETDDEWGARRELEKKQEQNAKRRARYAAKKAANLAASE